MCKKLKSQDGFLKADQNMAKKMLQVWTNWLVAQSCHEILLSCILLLKSEKLIRASNATPK
jgi:hypothetical protein